MLCIRAFGVVVLALIAVMSMVIMPAAAQSGQKPINLSLSPLTENIAARPGETVTKEVRLKNNGPSPENIEVSLMKFKSGGGGTPLLIERAAEDDYFDWVTFSEARFVAEPGVWKTVRMTISIPKSAAFGYYYAAVFSRSDVVESGRKVSGLNGGVAMLVLLDVSVPGAKKSLEITDFTAGSSREFLPVEFKATLKNTGNVHVAPAGSIFIKRGDKQVAVVSFNRERGNVLPGSEREYTSSWNDGFPKYTISNVGGREQQDLDWNMGEADSFRFGKYTATLVAVYDDGKRDVPVEARTTFWIIPWRIIGAALVVLLIMLAGLWFIARSLWRGLRGGRPPQSGSGGDQSASSEDGTEPPKQPEAGDSAVPPEQLAAQAEPEPPSSKAGPASRELPTAPLLPSPSQRPTPERPGPHTRNQPVRHVSRPSNNRRGPGSVDGFSAPKRNEPENEK